MNPTNAVVCFPFVSERAMSGATGNVEFLLRYHRLKREYHETC